MHGFCETPLLKTLVLVKFGPWTCACTHPQQNTIRWSAPPYSRWWPCSMPLHWATNPQTKSMKAFLCVDCESVLLHDPIPKTPPPLSIRTSYKKILLPGAAIDLIGWLHSFQKNGGNKRDALKGTDRAKFAVLFLQMFVDLCRSRTYLTWYSIREEQTSGENCWKLQFPAENHSADFAETSFCDSASYGVATIVLLSYEGIALPLAFTLLQYSGVYFNNVRRNTIRPEYNKLQGREGTESDE